MNFLRAKADINHADFKGRTPLINAVEGNCVRTVALLLTRGKGKINLDAEDGNFRRADDYARYGFAHPWIEEMLKAARGQESELPRIQLK